MTHPDVPAEQAHVDHAYARLEAMREAAAAMLRDAFGERGSTFQSVTERDIRVRTSLNRLDQLQIGREALVFGRIDTGTGDAFHLGRLAISDADQEPLVVDWRAPVAEPFYRATGAHPMGLRRRRHFLIEGQRVDDLQDELFAPSDDGATESDGTAGGVDVDEGLSGSQVLLATLERSRTGRMRDIVATVQREQDAIIRGPLPGLLIVQGGPGTGKTAVALHRAAYLLYTHRFPLEGQGVLVVGPNPTFLRYIEQVLPSLGETGVELSTVAALFGDLKVAGRDEGELLRLKGDPRMARFLSRAVKDRQRRLRRPLEVPYGRFVLRVTPEESAHIVSVAQRRPGTHNSRRRTVETLLWRALEADLERHLGPVTDSESERPDAAELGRELRHTPEIAEALERMWPILTPHGFLHDLFGAAPLIQLAGRNLLSASEQELLYRSRSGSPDEAAWTGADIPLLDEARALLGSPRRKPKPEEGDDIRAYGHVVVDEAQDLSPMQLRMLARRSLSGSMTVVGDIAQATGPWAPSSWDQVSAHLPTARGSRLVELTVNYRTPQEIMALAARVLTAAAPQLVPPESVRIAGEEPRIITVASPAAVTAGAVEAVTWARTGEGPDRETVDMVGTVEASGTTAVLAPPDRLAGLESALVDAGFEVGSAGEGALDSAVAVLAVDEAKGLEFDHVVVVEPAELVRQSAHGLHALYVALTRATRRLALVHGEPLPEALQGGVGADAAAAPTPDGADGAGGGAVADREDQGRLF